MPSLEVGSILARLQVGGSYSLADPRNRNESVWETTVKRRNSLNVFRRGSIVGEMDRHVVPVWAVLAALGSLLLALLELITASGDTVLRTTSSSAQYGRYFNLRHRSWWFACSDFAVRATLDVNGRQITQELSDDTGVCRPGTGEGTIRHVVDFDFPDGPTIEISASTDAIRPGERGGGRR